MVGRSQKTYRLLGADGRFYESAAPGALGGRKGGGKNNVYGRLDCRCANNAIARGTGTYEKLRVFFADEQTAIAAGFRPCGVCLPEEYAAWKAGQN